VKQIKDKMIINDLVRRKGKSKLPELWNEVLKQKKPNKNISNFNCKCDISIDEYTAIQKSTLNYKEGKTLLLTN
tara:strand:+ start:112 stop:333 length:222 start_codon:yes stop_codon:yes gene_type:complete